MADLETVASDLGWRFEIATKGGENSLSRATASRSSKRFDFGTSIDRTRVCRLFARSTIFDNRRKEKLPISSISHARPRIGV